MGGALPLTADQRRALEILADAGTRGCPEAVLTTMGFTIELLTQLLRAGFANRKVEPLSADYSPMKITETRQVEPLDHSAIGIAWMKITETGKLATGRINWRGQPANPAMR